MRRQRRLVWAAIIVVVSAMGIAALTELFHADIGQERRSLVVALRAVAYCIGAVGVIYTGLAFIHADRVVTSIARQFPPEANVSDNTAGDCEATALRNAIETHLGSRDGHIRRLETELKELRIQSQLARRREQQTEAIIYSLRDAVVVTDESGRLLVANEPAAQLFGFDAALSQHKPLAEVISSEHRDFVELLQRSRQSGVEATRRELMFMRAEEPHTLDTIVACILDRGKVSGVVAVLHDISREKEISQMKSDFVSHVSHELKTPLASITAYSEMLADGEADDEQTRKEFYNVIQTQAQRLNRLIEDILNVSRIESGLIKVQKEPVSLTILIEQQMQMIKGFAEDKNITVTGQKPIVFDQVYADKDMISQVIVNLLSNAVKYTPAGGSVKVQTSVDDTGGMARVTVTDTGVGIPADEVDHVFDKFYRVQANNKQAKGTGLGLNLVKQIVEKVHDGRVFVTSQVGAGSTFGFELPLATPELVEAA